MRKMAAAILTIILGLWLGCTPARAQFDAQATYVSTSGGTGTAITVLLPNVTNLGDLVGVPIRVLMAGSVTGPATLTVNSLAPVTISKKTTAGLQALTNGDVVNAQTAIFTYDGTVFELEGPQLNLATVPSTNGFVEPINLQINCTASANALTCAVKAANTGGDPTSLSPVYVPFADTTTTSGDPVWVTITAPISFTFAGGNTAGCSSGAPCRLWITLINNGGTVVLGLSNQSTTTSCFPLNEGVLQTTGTGTSGGNAAGTIFTSVSALSSKAVRIAGYVEWTTLATAGNWTSPNFVRLFGPGVKKPCDMVQRFYSANSTQATSGNTYTPSGTAPTPAGGLSVTSQAITPTQAPNKIRVFGQVVLTASGANAQLSAFIYDTTNSATKAVAAQSIVTGNTLMTIPVGFESIPGVTTAITYTLYAASNSTTLAINGSSTTQFFGTVSSSWMIIEEIMGALEPDNDNGLPLSKVG